MARGQQQPPDGRTGRSARFPLVYLLILMISLGVLMVLSGRGAGERVPLTGPTSSFFSQLDRHEVSDVTISATSVSWTGKTGKEQTATLPEKYDPTALIARLQTEGVKVTATQPSPWSGILGWIFPLLLFAAFWLFIMRRASGAAGAALGLGRAKTKIVDRREMKTTFADAAGVDEAVEELREVVDFLKTPARYQRLGGKIPKGVLLLGPPGCGKTLLARAVAGEADVPFFYMSGSEFVEMFVGLGAARVRDLFQQAKQNAPCLVFLDELDTIGKSRGGVVGLGAHEEREQTLNQLLVEMDGFDPSNGVIIMAATNRPEVLDPALTRPGRFDRQVVVDRPDIKGREAILKVHTRGVTLDPSVELHTIAARTPGFTGADLANVVNEAALLSARGEKNAVGTAELEEAIDRVLVGPERKSRVISEREKRIIAVHEVGHSLVALRVKHADPVHRVTIVPRGATALGMTMQRPLQDRYLMTEPELRDRVAVLMGGRAAEDIVFDEVSTGAQNDLERATEIARAMVVEYGMSARLGPLSFGRDTWRTAEGQPLFPERPRSMSELTAERVDEEITAILTDAHERANRILQRDRRLLDELAALLLEQEVIEGADLRGLVAQADARSEPAGPEAVPPREAAAG